MRPFRASKDPRACAIAALPALVALVCWIGQRTLWGQAWRETTSLSLAAASLGGRGAASTTCAAAERAMLAWATSFADARIDVSASFFWWRAGEDTHARYGALPPALLARAVTFGRDLDDGHKTLADLAYLRAPCVMYSFGGNAEVGFEAAVLDATPCDVWQFDCTVSASRMAASLKHVAPALRARFHFLPYCVGKDGESADLEYGDARVRAVFRSIASVMAELGHAKIDILKVDIEGSERAALPDFFSGLPDDARPSQVSFELHAFGAAAARPQSLFAPVVALARAGYVLINKRDNFAGWRGCCVELTFALCGVLREA